MRGAGGTVLAAGGSEVLRRVSGETVPWIAAEGLLPDVNSRALATAGEKAAKGTGMGERAGAGQAGEKGWAALRLCNLVAQSTGNASEAVQAGGREGANGAGDGTVGDYLFQAVPEPAAGH